LGTPSIKISERYAILRAMWKINITGILFAIAALCGYLWLSTSHKEDNLRALTRNIAFGALLIGLTIYFF